jgi:hypothetical protein
MGLSLDGQLNERTRLRSHRISVENVGSWHLADIRLGEQNVRF